MTSQSTNLLTAMTPFASTNKIKKIKKTHWMGGFILMLTGFFSGCTNPPSSSYSESSAIRLSDNDYRAPIMPKVSATHYLAQADQASDPQQKSNYRLIAANQMLQQHQNQAANQVLQQLDQATLTPEQHARYQLCQAQLLLTQHQPQQALTLLQSVRGNNTLLDNNQSLQLTQSMANAYADLHQPIASLSARTVSLNEVRDERTKAAIAHTTWDYLLSLRPSTIQAARQTASNPDTQGWLELLTLTQQTDSENAGSAGGDSPSTYHNFLNQLENWRQRYPNHPAQILVNNLHQDDVNSQISDTPQTVVLMLPLQGTYKSAGEAVKDGFFAAYYADPYRQQRHIVLLDTTQGTISQYYQQAQEKNASWVVGPLIKSEVAQLANIHSFPVPLLALNHSEQPLPLNQPVYQFSLSSQDELAEVADQAWQEHHSDAVIFAPDGASGQQAVQTLSQAWQQKGGHVSSIGYFNSKNSGQLAQVVRTALKIQQPNKTGSELNHLPADELRDLLKHRADVDTIFLLGSTDQAISVRAFLNYYLVNDLPIYSTSSISQPSRGMIGLGSDLRSVKFTNLPWNMPQELTPRLARLRQSIKQSWPQASSDNAAFFAMGVDAYQLTLGLKRLSLSPLLSLPGVTGQLSLNSQHRITRVLPWAQVVAGQQVRAVG